MKILIVDDASTNRNLYKVMLGKTGHIIEGAESAREAFYLLYEEKFDLILLDLFMPEIDGEEFLIRMRKDPGINHIPVIVITGEESAEVREKVIKAGANDLLLKGAGFKEIVEKIEEYGGAS